MNKYILELLKIQKTVILPGFGALSVVNEEKNDIMFMPYLKHDDGKLAEYISEHSNMDVAESKNSIAKFIREVQLQLDKGDSYDIFQFGVFSKTEEGDIEFESWKENYKYESIEEKEVIEEKETPVVPIKKVEEKLKSTQSEKKKIESESSSMTSIFITKDDKPIDKQEELTKNTEVYEKLKEERNQPQKKRRGAGFWVLLFLLLLLVGGGTFFGINYDKYKEYVPFLASNTQYDENHENEISENSEPEENTEEEITHDDSTEDVNYNSSENTESNGQKNVDNEENTSENETESNETNADDSASKDETPNDNVPTTSITNTSGKKGNYHAIMGAFAEIENANRLCGKLQEEGFPAHTFEHGSLTAVSIQSFETFKEANSKMKELREKSGSIWILKKKM